MASVFDYIINKKPEDITSGVLNFILEERYSSPIKSDLLQHLGIPNVSFTCSGQDVISDGRFDLFIRADDGSFSLIIENKLGANFTWNKNGEHQLTRYSRYLHGIRQGQKKLIVICPKKRRSFVQKEIKEYITFFDHVTEVIAWDEIALLLKRHNDPIVNNLIDFVDQRFLIDINIQESQEKMINSPEVGSAYFEVLKAVRKIYEDFDQDRVTVKLKFDNSDWSYGFIFKQGNAEYFFGIWPEKWADIGSILMIQKRTNTNTNENFKKIGDEYLCPIRNITSIDEIIEEMKRAIGMGS